MKILLASDGKFLMKEGYKLLDIPVEQMNIGYITTAAKVSRGSASVMVQNYKKEMTDNGYSYEEFDIEGKSKKEMTDFFANKNIIHVEGGNTYYLLKAIRESGFSDFLKESLNEGKIYIGTSAGAYVMCPTIEVSNWNDDGKDKFGLTDFTGLNYVPFVLKVHYKDEMKELITEKMKNLKYPLKILKDGQGIYDNNGEFSFNGEGEEIKLETPTEKINEIRNPKIF